MPSDGITGFGATYAAWSSAHSAASGYAPGAVWGPIVTPGQHQYSGVLWDHSTPKPTDVTVQYTLNFPSHTGAQEATLEALLEFPRDARVVHTTTGDGTCKVLFIKSADLAKHFNRLGSGFAGDQPYIELESNGGSTHFDPGSVSDALLGSLSAGAPYGGC